MTHPTDGLLDRLLARETAICMIGLGYVGLPQACCLARRFRVIGFDVNPGKVAAMQATHADTSDLQRLTGCRPQTSVEDGGRRFVAWYREYHHC